jgi:hypothetical protein
MVRGTQPARIGAAMKQSEGATAACVMNKKVALAAALLAAAAMLFQHEASASDGRFGASRGAGTAYAGARDANRSSRKAGAKHWISLHRPDGEEVHINTDHIVFVMSAAATGADKRANSKLQLVNGFTDVRESVEEVMRAVQSDDANQISER